MPSAVPRGFVVLAAPCSDDPDFLHNHPREMPTGSAGSAGMTMEGGEAALDWSALAPHIAHPTREGIVEAIRWIGEPLSKSDLLPILRAENPELSLSQVSYYVTTLVGVGILEEVSERVTAASMEALYFFPAP